MRRAFSWLVAPDGLLWAAPLLAATAFTPLWLVMRGGGTWPDRGAVGNAGAGVALWVVLLLLAAAAVALIPKSRFASTLAHLGAGTGVRLWDLLLLLAFVVLAARLVREPGWAPLLLAWGVAFTVAVVAPHPLRPKRKRRTAPAPPPLPEHVDPDHFVTVSLAWSLDAVGRAASGEIDVVVSRARLAQTREQNPGSAFERGTPLLGRWVTEGLCDEVDRTAMALLEISERESLTTFAEITLAVSVAQSIEYASDLESTGQTEYWRFPIETIAGRTGDCEDSTVLASAVLCRMGYPTSILLGPSHAALGVPVPAGIVGTYIEHRGQRYYYCETTSSGFRVGELPDGTDASSFAIVAVIPAETGMPKASTS